MNQNAHTTQKRAEQNRIQTDSYDAALLDDGRVHLPMMNRQPS